MPAAGLEVGDLDLHMLALHQGEQVSIDLSALPEAVLFDLDGVVTDTAEYHYQAWLKVAREIGVDLNRELNKKLKGVGREECLEILLQHNKLSFSNEKKKTLAEKKNYYYLNLINKINHSLAYDYARFARNHILSKRFLLHCSLTYFYDNRHYRQSCFRQNNSLKDVQEARFYYNRCR